MNFGLAYHRLSCEHTPWLGTISGRLFLWDYEIQEQHHVKSSLFTHVPQKKRLALRVLNYILGLDIIVVVNISYRVVNISEALIL